MYRPPQIERANDDISPDDESVQATNLGNFYSTDAPGRTSRRALSAYGVAAKANFEEWLRVRFDGVRPEGNTVAGSRMSPFKLWHYANTVKRQGTLFYRNPPGNADNLTEGPSNNIGPDHEIPLVPPQVT
jgi:hypothetical protein